MLKRFEVLSRYMTTGMMCIALGSAASVEAATPDARLVPSNGHAIATLTATGVQVYACEFDSTHHLDWRFKNPLATLYDEHGQAVVHHAAGPSWQADDGSRIEGHVLAQIPSQSTDSVPQLLLQTTSVSGNGMLSKVRYVQRIDTVGGRAPAEACTQEHEMGQSPYYAHYVFLE